VLVTGGSGLIGSATVAAIRRRGAAAISLGRGAGCDVRCDVRDSEKLRAAFLSTRPSCVVHTAYLLADESASEPREAIAVNLLGFVNALDASAAAGVSSFLYASSIAVYGDARRSDGAAASPSSQYGTMKLLNEQQAAACDAFARCCGVRIVNVYGDRIGRGQTGWLSSAIHAALDGRPARVELARNARMAVTWASDLGERLAAIALSPTERPWPAVVDGGGEEIDGGALAGALAQAGADDVALGRSVYPYPTAVASPWLDSVVGRPVTGLREALAAMAAVRGETHPVQPLLRED
jgi:nucleoside-diphosphate-sugar epimerase